MEYNSAKSAVDQADSLTSYYSCVRKTVRWYKKVAIQLICGIAVTNAMLLYNDIVAPAQKLSLLHFTESLVKSLLLPAQNVSKKRKSDVHQLEEAPGHAREVRRICKGCYEGFMTSGVGRTQALNKSKKVKTRCSACMTFWCLECFNNKHCSG